MALRISRAFKDISLSFARHPVTNDILTIRNEDAIKKSVTNLVKTVVGERFFNPLLGTTINESLFELNTSGIAALLEDEIKNVLRNFETRIIVKSIEIGGDSDVYELSINISYDIIGESFPRQNIEFILQPSRI
jgi:phage baseplate assembly protein W